MSPAGFPEEVEANTECSANIGGDWHARETFDGPCVNCGRALLPEACESCGDRGYELREITNEHDRKERACPKCKARHDRLAALEVI